MVGDHDADPAVFDEDGHHIAASMNTEPSGGPVDVLIDPDFPPAEAALILRKIADWVEDLMQPGSLAKLRVASVDRHPAWWSARRFCNSRHRAQRKGTKQMTIPTNITPTSTDIENVLSEMREGRNAYANWAVDAVNPDLLPC